MLTISLTPGPIAPWIAISQHDVGKRIHVALDDTLYYYSVKLICDTGVEVPAANMGSAVEFEVTEELSAISGVHKCKLQFSSSDSVIYSQMIMLNVEGKP